MGCIMGCIISRNNDENKEINKKKSTMCGSKNITDNLCPNLVELIESNNGIHEFTSTLYECEDCFPCKYKIKLTPPYSIYYSNGEIMAHLEQVPLGGAQGYHKLAFKGKNMGKIKIANISVKGWIKLLIYVDLSGKYVGEIYSNIIDDDEYHFVDKITLSKTI